jgi:para-nitrobenzyl esterase
MMKSMWRKSSIFVAMLAACGGGDDGGSDLDGGGDPDASAQCAATPGAPAEVVATTSGRVRGAQAGAPWAYKRVPFASPPVGDLRLRAPQPPACSATELDATALGPSCPQLDENNAFLGNEDCLHLNIWAPAADSASPRPVMFWIHGGGNAVGTAVDPIYDGRRLAEAGDVVVVTTNYRLGQLGFLADASLDDAGARGNYGTLDQIAALRWVRDNIAAFGGDPGNVMVFGESAGGRNTCTLLAAPAAAGLFHRALVQSGACKFLDTEASAQTTADAVATALACSGDRAACFRAATAEQITRANAQPVGALTGGTYGSVIDGVTLVEQPEAAIAAGRHHKMPFAIGANADETVLSAPATLNETAYQNLVRAQYGQLANAVLAQYPSASYASPRAAYVRLTTDSRFVCPSREIAAHADAGQTEPVYRYFFRYAPTAAGSPHGLDVPFVFGTFDAVIVQGNPYQPTANDLALAAAMQGYWSRFARTGTPAGTPAWPAYDATDTVLVLDDPLAAEAAIRDADCDFWRPYYNAL